MTPSLSEEICWNIINLIDWNAPTADASLTAAASVLEAMEVNQIYLFHDWLVQKLFDLDTPAHAANYRTESGYLSVDGFLYNRCSVVAGGETYYNHILANPDEMPALQEYEHLLYLASDAYENKTGKEFIQRTDLSYETYQNKSAWEKED